jgi:hypothetical protein
MVQQMVAWLASRAVMPAPVAVRQVQALTALRPLAMAGQVDAPADSEAGLKLAGAYAMMAVGR